MELRIYSPAVKVTEGYADKKTIPHYEEGDQLCGVVNLDPTCSQSGRITVTVSSAAVFMHTLS